MILDYYYYKSLNAKEKQAYKEMHSGIQNYLGSICLANVGYTEDEIQRIFTAILDMSKYHIICCLNRRYEYIASLGTHYILREKHCRGIFIILEKSCNY